MNGRATAVGVAGVSKTFRIPRQHIMSFKERALHPFKRVQVTDLHALKDVSFEIEQGEFFGIAGRNGSGKSTLLKCMAGVYRVDQGEITVAGRLVPFIELGVGFNQEMTALDNVVINGVMMGMSPREAQRRFHAVVGFAELEGFLDLKLKNYSSGMQVRLAFALMVQADADVLLIDEVLAVGDAAFQQKCFDAFHDLRERGKTVVLVTHDMQMVERFCQRAMLLDHGVVADIGDPPSVARRYLELNFEEAGEAEVTAARPGDLSHGVAIGDVWVEGQDGRRADSVGQGDPLVIRAEIESLAHIDDPEVGVSIHDESGAVVFGTTTRELGREEEPFQRGDRLSLRIALRNDLRPARYYVDCGVHEGTHRVAAFRPRATDFLVFGNRAQSGLVALEHTFELERQSDRTEAATTP